MKDTKEELNKCRDIPCSWIGRLDIIKIAVLPNLTMSEGSKHSVMLTDKEGTELFNFWFSSGLSSKEHYTHTEKSKMDTMKKELKLC